MNNDVKSVSRILVGIALLGLLSAILSACGALGGGAGNPLPTPIPGEAVGSGAKSQAKDTYQATWDSYLRDAIAADNQNEDVKIGMLQRYELPSITKQNLSGILKSTDLLTDRTKFALNSTNTVASSLSDFDVRLTFANGDTDTRHCRVQISIQQNADDKLWYVVNPAAMSILSICGKT